jgi:transcriptional regulator with AAA-type ATPase domain/tetratricopeptide (TPR) repeat protein
MVLDSRRLETRLQPGRAGVVSARSAKVNWRFRISALRGLEPRLRVIVAHALALAGELDDARQLAKLDHYERSTPLIRSKAESVLALVLWREADMDGALHHFHAAVRLAHESTAADQIAWAHLHLFRCLIDGHPNNTALAMLPDIRRLVTRAADPQISAYLHSCVAVLAGQMGQLDEARRHCELAESLLEMAPNQWLLGNSLVSRSTLAILDCDLERAFQCLTQAKNALSASGRSRAMVVCEGSLAHLQLLTGQFEGAKDNLSKLLSDPRTPRAALIGLSETLARAFLAEGRFDECQTELDRIYSGTPDNQKLTAYHIRWAAITNGRLLVKQHKFLEASDWLHNVERATGGTIDISFSAQLNLVGGCAAAGIGKNGEAAARLFAAHEAGILTLPELQAQYYYASAQILGTHSPALQTQLRDRALRLWAAQGIVSVRMEMDDADSADPAKVRDATVLPDAASVSVECVTDSLAAMGDLAHRPRLLGVEMASVIRALDCSPEVTISETSEHSTPPTASLNQAVLPLGGEQLKALALVCKVPSDPLKAILLANVLRIGRAALTVERARRAERNRAAVWPASPAEEQAGGLFLAEEMQTLLATARRVAPTSAPILITGETGTGKEVLARTIHAYSDRSKAIFLPFNCSGVPRDMLDSQLFGHRKGSFTGATEHFPGVIRAATGGTLFLDEIGDTTLEVQPKLLRFLDSHEVHPIGELQPVAADVRVIAATNANLDALMADGSFREDLFYRLNIVRLHVPPLRERRTEIPAFADHYLRKHAQEYHKGNLRLSEETIEYLVLYRWPGNVRQLANEMRRMAALAETGAILMPEHLSPDIARYPPRNASLTLRRPSSASINPWPRQCNTWSAS